MNAKVWAALFAEACVFAALLFGGAGRIDWWQGWMFLTAFFIPALVVSLRLARDDPALMRQRMASPIQSGQPLTDKVLMGCIALVFAGWLVAMGFEGGRHPAPFPPWLEAIGAIGVSAMFVLADRVMHANTFLAPMVRIQDERGQHVVDTGPYAVVRHPFYSAALILFVSAPLLLDSWWGEAGAAVLAAALALRILLEERVLRTSLNGYGDYAARVRYRLVPRIW
jgi:protein-S-isoprenylcysteine O-methyltransferase Ste14